MGSFSDQHEGRSIPIIAANLHRLIPVVQNQIWAVLRAEDTLERICWSLAAGLLGRLCVSGDIDQLSSAAAELMVQAIAMNDAAQEVLRSGRSRRQGRAHLGAWNHPHGYQAVVRSTHDQCLVVVHAFAGHQQTVEVTLPEHHWQEQQALTYNSSIQLRDNSLLVTFAGDQDQAGFSYCGHAGNVS